MKRSGIKLYDIRIFSIRPVDNLDQACNENFTTQVESLYVSASCASCMGDCAISGRSCFRY